ncbi:hypothetical protein JTE90_024005 [Oedothorax gibbosus]|uniref:EGF-like domain-containing protein n=1 Tax=Oedothorax gibbosus TaxID=931172 RepID=A0AAV6VCC8_9ARAC|nr:hypothetical protein JTE90_024005 [Oedothorax gibbosus]
MKWALVLALVLCCGLTKGETENDSIESLDKLTEQLEQELLFRPRTLLADKLTCGEIECKNGATNCIDDGKCECIAGFTGDDCAQVVCGTNKCKNGATKCQEEDKTKCDCPEETTEDDCSQVTGCVDGLQAICDNLGLKCIYDPQTPKKAACSCTENKKFDGETCKETCDAENDNCFNEAQCEAQNGYNFCTCVQA